MLGGRGVERIALLMLAKVSRFQVSRVKCALGLRDVVRAMPRYPPGSGSIYNMLEIEVVPTRTWAKRACRAMSRSVFRLISWSAWI